MKPTIRYWYFVNEPGNYDWDYGSDNYSAAKLMANELASNLYMAAREPDAEKYGDDKYLGAWVEIHNLPMYPDDSTGDCCSDGCNYRVRIDPDDGELEWVDYGPGDDDGEPDEPGWYDRWIDTHRDWLEKHPEMDAFAEYFGDD